MTAFVLLPPKDMATTTRDSGFSEIQIDTDEINPVENSCSNV